MDGWMDLTIFWCERNMKPKSFIGGLIKMELFAVLTPPLVGHTLEPFAPSLVTFLNLQKKTYYHEILKSS